MRPRGGCVPEGPYNGSIEFSSPSSYRYGQQVLLHLNFSGDPLDVANAGTAQRLLKFPRSIARFQNPPGARRKSPSPAQVPQGDSIASRSHIVYCDLSRISWADLHKLYQVLPRGPSMWNAPVESSCA